MLNGLLCESAGIPANPPNGLALGACVVCELFVGDAGFAVAGAAAAAAGVAAEAAAAALPEAAGAAAKYSTLV